MGYSTSGEFTNAERTKLTGIEALADVTDDANVEAANDVIFSGAKGFMKKTSAGVYDLITSQELNADIIDFIRQMHPNISVLAAMDDATRTEIEAYSGIFKLYKITTDLYDNHNDESVDLAKWTFNDSGAYGFLDEDTEKMILRENGGGGSTSSNVTTDNASANWYAKCRHATNNAVHAKGYIGITGATGHEHQLTADANYQEFIIKKTPTGWKLYEDGVLVETWTDANSTCYLYYKCYADNSTGWNAYMYIDQTEDDGTTTDHEVSTTGSIYSNAIAANAALLSFFSYMKGNFSNGASTHALPVGVEIYGNGDSYAAALNATTKFKIDPTDSIIELYRTDDSEVAKSDDQTDWVLDDNATNGAFAAKTTSTHETILAEEIGCASIVLVEKSVNGAFTDTEILIEDDDYTVDYSTRTATKIVLTSAEAADIVISQSKLRITWIADVEDIEGTANTALKMKIYLNRTAVTEASPEIQKIDLGTDKYAEMQYLCG